MDENFVGSYNFSRLYYPNEFIRSMKHENLEIKDIVKNDSRSSLTISFLENLFKVITDLDQSIVK